MAHHRHHRHLSQDSGAWKQIENVWKKVQEEAGHVMGQQQKRQDDDFRGQSTVVRTVFETRSPTFTGAVGGMRTVNNFDTDTTQTATTTAGVGGAVQASPRTTTTSATSESSGSSATSRATSKSAATSIPSAITEPSKSSINSNLAVATDSPAQRGSADQTTTANAVSSASASASSESSSDSGSAGMSAGEKAGIALGVLGGVAIIGLLVFFIFSRRKKQMEAKQQANNDDNEKWSPPPLGAAATIAAAAPAKNERNAPRLSLRPVTQFLPNFGADKRASKGANMMLAPTGAAASGPVARSLTPNHDRSAWERPTTSESTNPNNPFGNQAERMPTPIMEESRSIAGSEKPLPPGPTSPQSPDSGTSPFDDPANVHGNAMAAAVGAAAGTTLTRKTSTRKDGPKALDLTLPAPMAAVPPSPAGTEFSDHSVSSEQPAPPPSAGAAAIAAAGGPANSAVHRVQLDFKPTMEDEMELRAGQLVRLLHEFDDGWALCIRLDRSQQGVVPRTCLSTRPVKPRPQNGPPGPPGPPGPGRPGPPRGPGPHGRPMTPQGGPRGPPQQRRPESPMRRPMPGPGRPQSPAGGPRGMSPGPRSQSPGPRFQGPPGPRPQSPGMGPRPQSPGPRFQGPPRPRPQSPNGMGPRGQSPAGMGRSPMPSPMNPGAPSPQGRSRAGSTASGPPTGPINRKPVPGEAY